MTNEEWFSFDRCWAFLEPALKHYLPTHGKEDFRAEVSEGRAVLWPLQNSAVLVKVEEYKTGLKLLRIWLAGGRLDELKAFAPWLRTWARSHGCTKILVEGRPGWGRVFEQSHKIAETWIEELN